MKSRATPKLDAARVAVAAIIATGEACGWTQRRLRAELRVGCSASSVSRTTWRTAVVLVTGRGLRRLKDPRGVMLAKMKGRAA